MTNATHEPATEPRSSLLDEIASEAAVAAPAKKKRSKKTAAPDPASVSGDLSDAPAPKPVSDEPWQVRADRKLRGAIAACWTKPFLRYPIAAVLFAGTATGGWLAWDHYTIAPPPDYQSESLDVLFNYTLLTDDFNKLPPEERLALVEQLMSRLRGMGTSDSVLMAMFASMIAGPAREQLEENVSRLAVDMFDSYAVDYNPSAAEGDREAYLQDAVVKFQETIESLTGQSRDLTREERLGEMREQARRDLEYVESGNFAADEALRMFDVLNNGVGRHASGHQKLRIARLVRDASHMLRKDIEP